MHVCVCACVQLDPESESTFTTLDLYDREAQLVIDYSSLAAELRVRHETTVAPNISEVCVYSCSCTTPGSANGRGGRGLPAQPERGADIRGGHAVSHHCPQHESSGED